MIPGLLFSEQEKGLEEYGKWLTQSVRDFRGGREPVQVPSPSQVRRMLVFDTPPEIESLPEPQKQEWESKAEKMGFFDNCLTLAIKSVHYDEDEDGGSGTITFGCDDSIWMGADFIVKLASLCGSGAMMDGGNSDDLYSAATQQHQVKLNHMYPFEDAVRMCRWRIAL